MDNWEYVGDDEVRYLLGKIGKNNLLVIGVNPSTATPLEPDNTINKVIKISETNGYDGWIMVNLYPQRSIDPNGMIFSPQLMENNLKYIEAVCKKFEIKHVWCAWGDLIDTFGTESFLHDSWKKIKTLLENLNVTFYYYDTLTKKGNPRHPLYVSYGREFHKFFAGGLKIFKTALYGAILGDIIGSPFEGRDKRIKTKNFELFSEKSKFTDDTVMTIAVADAFLKFGRECDEKIFEKSLQSWGKKFPHRGYGGSFREWLQEKNPKPYNSFGNGSAMRISAVGWLFDSIFETRETARITAKITHNHREGIKGAMAVACAIFLARKGAPKKFIKNYVESEFDYALSRSLDDVRKNYKFEGSCQKSVPEAIIAFLESENFEDAIRNAVSLGGDADTQAAIAGSIAEAFYGVPENFIDECRKFLPEEILEVVDKFNTLKDFFTYDLNHVELEKKIAEKNLQSVKEEFAKILGKKSAGIFSLYAREIDSDGNENFCNVHIRKDGKEYQIIFTNPEEVSKGNYDKNSRVNILTVKDWFEIFEKNFGDDENVGFVINPFSENFIFLSHSDFEDIWKISKQ